MTKKWRTLGDELKDLEESDPEVKAAAERLEWHSQKVAMNWPEPKDSDDEHSR